MFSNLSIKLKLVLLLLPALLTLVVFAAIAAFDRFDTASVANDATNELEVAESANLVIRDLGVERSAAVQLLINSMDGRQTTDAARTSTDVAVAGLTSFLDGGNAPDLDSRSRALDALQQLAATRQQVDTFAIEQAEAYANYNRVIDDLLTLETEVLSELGDTELLRQGQLVLAGIQGQERVSRQAAFLGTRLELIELTAPDFVTFSAIQNEELLFFSELEGADEISQLWQTSRTSRASIAGDALVEVVNDAGQGGSIPNISADVWWEQMSAKAESFDSAAAGSFDTLLDNSDSKASSARTGAVLFGVIGLFIILLALLMALALARSIARRLVRLSEEANTIATERLPEVLESLRNPTPEALAGAMPTIDSDANDEIGLMANSFDTVLRTSVETSIEHSQQRAKTINDLLVNLGRRNQTLIGRQLALIDDLEAKEEDPALLETLYNLDSLITRNRRNSENLLVLAGEAASRSSNAPVTLYELVQAATGEVSEFERVEITGNTSGEEMLLGTPAVDLSHLVAELLDNALSFSAKTTKVTAHIDSKKGRHRIWVIDEGIGMTDDELKEANARLLDPTDIDELSADRIGFQVVGRIAQRLGTTVTLTANPRGGLAAGIGVPPELLLSDDIRPTATASETVPEPQPVAPAASTPVQAAEDYGSLKSSAQADRRRSRADAAAPPNKVDAHVAATAASAGPQAFATGSAAAEVGVRADATPANATPAKASAPAAVAGPVQKSTTPVAGPIAGPVRGPTAQRPGPMPAPTTVPATGGTLNRRKPGESLATNLKIEAVGRVSHRRLGDGRSSKTNDAAADRKKMNSRLARSIDRRGIKEQN